MATVENATAGMEPECGNFTVGNCTTLEAGAMEGGSPGAWMIGSLILYGLICAAGTIGNGLVIYVVLRYVFLSVRLPFSLLAGDWRDSMVYRVSVATCGPRDREFDAHSQLPGEAR